MNDRWLLRTKTSIFAIIGILPQILPQFGLTFTQDDVTFFSGQIDAIWTGLFAILTLYGRYDAGGTKLLPGKPGN